MRDFVTVNVSRGECFFLSTAHYQINDNADNSTGSDGLKLKTNESVELNEIGKFQFH